MSRIYRNTDKRLPKELRAVFDEVAKRDQIFTRFEAKAANLDPEDEMIIEGIANKAELDRVNEVIDPKAWDLKNYLKSPVILYEHDRHCLVGKALKCSVEKDGLYYKAQIGNPKAYPCTPEQMKVRSLLAQGLLLTNSVGFRPYTWEWDDENEILRYTGVELLEISLVSIPMQQDSIITSVKSWRTRAVQEPQEQQEPTIAEVKAAVDETKALVAGVKTAVESFNAAESKAKAFADENAALKAEIEALKTANTALTAEVEELRAKALTLVDEMTKRGLLKQPA